jgi:hypothetical protein
MHDAQWQLLIPADAIPETDSFGELYVIASFRISLQTRGAAGSSESKELMFSFGEIRCGSRSQVAAPRGDETN